MSWEVKQDPKYHVDVCVDGIELIITYDVAGMHPEEVWDEAEVVSDIIVRGIWHEGIDIKRIVRGFPRGYINEIVFKKHHNTWLRARKS